MYQPTQRPTDPMIAAWKSAAQKAAPKHIRLRRLAATSAFALLSLMTYQPSAQAQTLSEGEFCYAIADNNPPGGGSGEQDTLVLINDFVAGQATVIGGVSRGNPGAANDAITNIEALTSRPISGELIAANGNEIGKIDPATGVFTLLGVLGGPDFDFDAIVINRNSPGQTRLIGIAKSGPNNNVIVQADIILGADGLASGLNPVSVGPTVDLSEISGVTSIDGIAFSPNNGIGIVYGVANGGVNTPQRLVTIDLDNGNVQDLGPFLDGNGALIPDVEDLSFDLTGGILFATSGSNFSEFSNFAFIFSNPNGQAPAPAPAIAQFDLGAATGAQDFEASACIFPPVTDPQSSDLLLVKRITAITRNGAVVRYDDQFDDQVGDGNDNFMFSATGGAFPLGLVESPTPLAVGDLVEYTIYLYNPTAQTFSNVALCDPIQLPSILQSDTIEFSSPAAASLALDFSNQNISAKAPLEQAEGAACLGALGGENQFLGDLNGAGGGVVTDLFNISPGQISATRFVIEVGQLQQGQTLGN